MSSAGDTLTIETTKGPVVIEMNPVARAGPCGAHQALRLRGFL